MSSEEKDRESGKTSTAVAPPPLVAEISQNTNNEDDEGPTNEQTDLMEFFQNLAQEMSPLQQSPPPPPPPPPEELAAAAAAESQKQQQKQQQHGHRSRGRRQGIKISYISTDDHLDTLIGGSITSAAASAVVEPIDNNINDGPMMMIQEHPGSPQKTHSSITPTPVHRTLANIEEQMVTIRNKLEKRSPKVTTAQLNQKLDRIINILRKMGFPNENRV